MGWLEDLFGTSSSIVTGAILIGTGVGVTMLTGNLEDKKLKLVPQIGGLALAGLGAYKIYTGVTNPLDIIKTGDNIGMQLTHPTTNDLLQPLKGIPFDFGVGITNSTDRKKNMYVECTITNLNELIAYHLPPHTVTLNSGEFMDVKFNYPTPPGAGNEYALVFSLWDKIPTQTDMETENTPNRILTTGWLPFWVAF